MNDQVPAVDFHSVHPSLVRLVRIIYGLYALAALITMMMAIAFFLPAMLVFFGPVSGLPPLIAVILGYLKRGEAKGSWLESHFRWQIRTFWFSLPWLLVVYPMLMLTMNRTCIMLAFLLIPLIGLWVGYRVARGWIALAGVRPVGS
ncbi:MAG: hypothetical protein FWC58_06975 [Desulfobulbus sp.]|nr:hypothetical protein [Desulfobulbus sp.]